MAFKIKQEFTTTKLNQIAQQANVTMAFAKKLDDKTLLQLHQFVLCRDYFNEVLQSNWSKLKYSVYGFTFQAVPGYELDTDKTRILYNFGGNTEFKTNFYKNIAELNGLEFDNKLETTKIYDTEDPNVILCEGDIHWSKMGYLTSFYTYMLRVLSYNFQGKSWIDGIKLYHGTNECNYLNDVSKNLDKFITNIKKFPVTDSPTGWSETESTSYLHNYSGFVTLLGNHTYIDRNSGSGGNVVFDKVRAMLK